jgi:AcrR family transcriptional regulator|tara:strand:- start:90 stop:716 length:627 start_codon:yes stop_codon:yes gene_type:complete
LPKKPKTDQEIAAFRERVCEVATELFVERGPDNVTMRQIAAGVGVSPMTPYRYFQDKDEILATVRAAALDRFAAALEAGLAQGSDARERARAIGDAYVRFATEHPAAYQLMSEISQVDESRYPELVRASRRARETMVGYVRDMIREGMMDGDADLIGYMFWSTLHGIVVLDMAGRLGGEIDADTLRKKTMRTLLAGMAVSPPRREDES